MINSSPVLSNLKPDKPSIASAIAPNFSHATSRINVSKENQGLTGDEVRYDVDSLERLKNLMWAEIILLNKRKEHMGGLGNIPRETCFILKTQILYFLVALLWQPIFPKEH